MLGFAARAAALVSALVGIGGLAAAGAMGVRAVPVQEGFGLRQNPQFARRHVALERERAQILKRAHFLQRPALGGIVQCERKQRLGVAIHAQKYRRAAGAAQAGGLVLIEPARVAPLALAQGRQDEGLVLPEGDEEGIGALHLLAQPGGLLALMPMPIERVQRETQIGRRGFGLGHWRECLYSGAGFTPHLTLMPLPQSHAPENGR